MRIKKLRGHNRIWKDIEAWKNENLKLDIESLKSSQRDHTKIWVSPYCDYNMLNSEYPQPKGKTRQKILNGLIEIYTEWKKQLDALHEPYYLKIWPQIKSLPAGFNWECRLDEMHLSSTDLGKPEDYYDEEDYLTEKRAFEKRLKKPHRKMISKSEDGEVTEYYSFKVGHAWLGSKD